MRRLLVFLLTCTAFGLQAGESAEKILQGLPPVLAECEHAGELQAYGEAKLGCSIKYRQPGVLVSVFAYDFGQKDIPDGIDGKAVQEAFQDAIRDIKDAERQGYYQDLAKRELTPMKSITDRQALRARYHLTRLKGTDAGKLCCSEIVVFGARGLIIKLRVTSGIEFEAVQQKALEQFLPALFAALKKPDPQKVPDSPKAVDEAIKRLQNPKNPEAPKKREGDTP